MKLHGATGSGCSEWLKTMSKSCLPDSVHVRHCVATLVLSPPFYRMHHTSNAPCTHHSSRQPILQLFKLA